MLRSVLVALDATPASAKARRLAIDLAARLDCEVTGLAVLDRQHITAPSAVGIGGMAYKHHRDQVKLEEAKAFLETIEQTFRQSCEESGSRFAVVEAEGIPHRLIEQESSRHDLLVIGKDTDFHFDVDPSTAETVQRLLRENPRPLVVVPEQAPEEGVVVAAHDGSVRSSRALHMLALLGLAKDRTVHVVAVADDQETADAQARVVTELFVKHGHQAKPHAVASGARPSDIVLAEAEALGAAMVAMGASGHSALHDFFLGSTTQRLLDACPCPLFVHH